MYGAVVILDLPCTADVEVYKRKHVYRYKH